MAEFTARLVASRKGAHIIGVLLTAMGVFLLISLLTHSHFDAPNSSHFREGTFNWGGRIGAHLSYGLFTAIGYAAFVVPVVALTWGWNRFRQQAVRGQLIRSAGLVGLALFFSVATGLPAYSPYTAFELGGWLGTQVSSKILIPYAGRIGSVVILGALFAVSLILTTDVDPRRLASGLAAVGRVVSWALSRFRAAIARVASIEWRRRGGGDEDEDDTDFDPDEDEEVTNAETPGFAVSLPSTGGREREDFIDEGENVIAEPQAVDDEATPERDAPALPVAAAAMTIDPSPTKPPGRRAPAPSGNGKGNGASRPKNGDPDEKQRGSQGSNGSSAPKAGAPGGGGKYRVPALSLLDSKSGSSGSDVQDVLLKNAHVLEEALSNFDVQGKIVEISPGPVVTRYEVEPAPGVKVNRIVTLSDDLARVMSAEGIRIQAPVPGKSVVGVEIANRDRETVYLREVLESKMFRQADARLTMALGKTISGEPYVTDLAKMPHLLVAGATGAGKSVCINCLISSILFKATPDDVRLLMVDPKVVELTAYNGIPHLLVPVITEPKKASEALKWAVAEMESRYQLLAKLRVRSLEDYNHKVRRINAETKGKEGEGEEYKTLPCIVIVVDEFADLMLTAPADVETSLMSLAQKSRAIGIHLILATQRPSVNVITGVIKANFPSRIAFHVASKTDSRTILDMNGAERLLGKGDMLFLPGGQGEPIRIHGAFVSGEETERLVESIKAMNYEAKEVAVLLNRADINPGEDDRDELFDEAVNVVVEHEQASTSFLQRRMKIGYSRAARLMDELELAGIVGPAEGAKPRQILIEGMAADEDALDS